MGALRRAYPRTSVGWGCAERRKSLQRFVAAGVRHRCGNFVRHCPAGRWTHVQPDEARPGCRGMGTARPGRVVVAGVVVIALGWDTRFLSQFTFLSTAATEQKLIAQLKKQP